VKKTVHNEPKKNRNERKKSLTIIVPCYNEQESINLFYEEIEKVSERTILQELKIDLLFIDDGSSDNTKNILKELVCKHDNISYISFSRNFGKEAAIYAGLENSKGDYCVLMDADLQDPPDLLEEMYLSIKSEGYDCVATKRVSRKGEPFFRSYFAKKFYKIINLISTTEIVDGARDFRMMTRQMVDAIVSLKEYHRFSKGLFSWVGFKVKYLSYENIERIAGKTKWSFWGLFVYSLDGILAFSTVPLAFVSILGIVVSFISIIGIIFIIIRTIVFGDPVSGWPSMVTIISFIGGLQLFCLGIIGQYLSKAYLETKRRPIYIVKASDLKNNMKGS
jgi:glycosyltransferase involved in cell wall biosynthesis